MGLGCRGWEQPRDLRGTPFLNMCGGMPLDGLLLREMRDAERLSGTRKVDIRLPGNGNSNAHGTKPVRSSHLCDQVDPNQLIANKELSLSLAGLYRHGFRHP